MGRAAGRAGAAALGAGAVVASGAGCAVGRWPVLPKSSSTSSLDAVRCAAGTAEPALGVGGAVPGSEPGALGAGCAVGAGAAGLEAALAAAGCPALALLVGRGVVPTADGAST